MKPHSLRAILLLLAAIGSEAIGSEAWAEPQTLTPRLHHLRRGDAPEWADFPKQAEGPSLKLTFRGAANVAEATLRIRQQDVRDVWKVQVNGKNLGSLVADENDMTICLAVPPGVLRSGANTLIVEQAGKLVDDIRVGEIVLDPRPLDQVLSEGRVEVTVLEGDERIPCRITILDENGSLATVRGRARLLGRRPSRGRLYRRRTGRLHAAGR